MLVRMASISVSFRFVLVLIWATLVLGCDRPQRTPPPAAGPPGGAKTTEVEPSPVPSPGKKLDTVSPMVAAGSEVALLAGGCFWGMEDILREVPGVLETDVGYTGGKLESPTYDDVKRGTTGHAESVRVVFDPKKISYAELLEQWFFRMHDPTTEDRQGNDVGTQYRSAIFYTTEEQKRVAHRIKERVETSGQWNDPVVTEIVEAGEFTVAEGHHQDYLEKNPGGYTCHYMRDPVH